MPGEPELNHRTDRLTNGIDVDQETIEQLLSTGENFGLNRKELVMLLETSG